ncbi:hypothetical protein HDU93_003660, partial [Gonapodya sp. JEL0774]
MQALDSIAGPFCIAGLHEVMRFSQAVRVKEMAIYDSTADALRFLPPDLTVETVETLSVNDFSIIDEKNSDTDRLATLLKVFPSATVLSGNAFFPAGLDTSANLEVLKRTIPQSRRESISSIHAIANDQLLIAPSLYPNVTDIGWINIFHSIALISQSGLLFPAVRKVHLQIWPDAMEETNETGLQSSLSSQVANTLLDIMPNLLNIEMNCMHQFNPERLSTLSGFLLALIHGAPPQCTIDITHYDRWDGVERIVDWPAVLKHLIKGVPVRIRGGKLLP